MMSFAGNVTFANAQPLRDAAAAAPADLILAETDAPFLTPVPNRGKPNEPALTADTLRCLAEVKGRQVLDKFNCAGCHLVRPGVYEFKASEENLKGLEANIIIDDPDTFNAPLTLSKRWFKVDLPMIEVVCSENNDDHFNQNLYPIPLADKPDF
jgi:hypothetical protein